MATLTNKTIASTYTSLLKLEGDTGSTVAGNNSNAVQVKTGDNDATPLYLNTDRLGIGGQPKAKLDISGDTGTWAGMAKVFLTDVNSNSDSRNWSIGNGGTAYGALSFIVSNAEDGVPADSTGTAVMVLDGVNKKAAIGTASPKNILHVSDGSTSIANNSDGILISSATTGKLIFEDTGEGSNDKLMMLNHYDESLKIMSINDAQDSWEDYQIATFNRNGHVGFGTLTPSHGRVEIVGNSDAFQLTMSDVADSDDTIKEARMGMLHYKQAEEPVTLFYAQSGSSENAIYIGGGTGVGNHATSVSIATASTYNSTSTTTNMKIDNNSRVSLSNNDNGTQNTVFGSLAGTNIAAGTNYNVFIGHNVAGGSLDAATENTGVGYSALANLTSGDTNTAIGRSAGLSITTGAENTIVGDKAGDAIGVGNSNTLVGQAAGGALTDGDNNVAIGASTLPQDDLGQGSTAVGAGALSSQNMASEALTKNVGIGYQAGFYNVTGTSNSFLGYRAGFGASGQSNSHNVGIGESALLSITSGTNNVVIGSLAGDAMTDNVHNVIIGKSAFSSANSGEDFNIVIGADAGTAIDNASADNNILIGQDAGTGGSGAMASCIAIGRNAMNSTGTNAQTGTIAIGHNSLTALTSGERNTAVGYNALDAEDAGHNNTAVGYEALTAQNNNTGSNTAVGMRAGLAVTTGYSNTLLGSGAGATLQGGYQNTFIGRDADSSSTAISQTVIGRAVTGNQNYGTVIGNTGMFQFASKEYQAHQADGEDLKSASAGEGFKLPAYSIIKSISVVVTQLSNLGTFNVCLVLADESVGVGDNTAFTNPVEVLGAGVAATLSGNSSSAVDIALGSGAVVKQSYHMDEAISVGASDKYLHVAQAGTGNGDTNPSTNGLLNVMVEYIGQD